MVDAIFTVLPHYLANLLAGSNNRELKYPRKYVNLDYCGLQVKEV